MDTYNVTLYEGEDLAKAKLPLPDNIAEDLRSYLVKNDFLRKKGEGGLRFVGTFQIKTEEYCLRVCSLPKYLERKQRAEYSEACAAMVSIRKVIEKTGHLFDYAESEAEFDPFRQQVKGNRVSRYEMAKWLVADYEKNGAFTVRERKQTRANRGRILWNRTIMKTTPIIDGDEVAYVSPINVYVARNDKVLLSDVHRCAVKEAMDDLGEEAEMTVEPLYREELLGHLDQFAAVIKSYQRSVFAERDIMLLRYLEAWCTYHSNYYNKPIGTVSFELVWEDVLRGVLGHKDLDGKVGFGAPKYHICNNDYTLQGDSIPDVMNFWKTEGGYRFVLIDGKYYRGKTKGNSLYELPGYKDIAKQIDYYETLCKTYGLSADCGQNMFILPRWDALHPSLKDEKFVDLNGLPVRYVGYTEKPDAEPQIASIVADVCGAKSEETKKDKVQLLQIEPEPLYRLFLGGAQSTERYADMLWEYVKVNEKPAEAEKAE